VFQREKVLIRVSLRCFDIVSGNHTFYNWLLDGLFLVGSTFGPVIGLGLNLCGLTFVTIGNSKIGAD